MRWFLGNPMAHLVAFAAGLTACLCIYLLAGVSVSRPFADLSAVGWSIMVVLWADADARRRLRVPCFDFGFLLAVYFPLSVAWYCMWSRGWRGVLLIGGLLALVVVPYAVAGVVWLVLYGRA